MVIQQRWIRHLAVKTELVPQFRFVKLTHPLDYFTDRNGVIDWVFFEDHHVVVPVAAPAA